MKNRTTSGLGSRLLTKRKKTTTTPRSSNKNTATNDLFGNRAKLSDTQSALELILKRNELLRLASSVAKLGYFELNRKTYEMIWSSQLLDIFDVKRGCEPMLGQSSCDLIFKEDYAEVLQAFQQAIGGVYNPVSYRIKSGSGKTKILQTTFSGTRDNASEDIVFGTTQDVTEIRKKETEVLNKERELRFITDSAPVLIIRTNMDTTIQYVNGNNRKWIGNKVMSIFHADSRRDVKQKIEQAIRSGRSINFDVKAASLQKNVLWYNATVKKVDYVDTTSALIFIVQDITGAKEMKQIMSDAIAEAEVKERKRIAADLHDGVCQHLATIHLSIDTIQKMLTNQDAETTQFILETKQLITETLTMARKVSHDLMPVDLFNSGFLKGIKAVITRLNRVDKIKYSLTVWGREKKLPPNISNNLYRIVQEFIHNSEKHSEATEITIHIRYRQRQMQLSIADNGKGFNPEKIQKSSGIGLQNMVSRVRTFTDDYEFKAEEGKGVSLFINIPF